MHYDFDLPISRRDTHSVKWGLMQDEADPLVIRPTDAYYDAEKPLIPMWVADMDFACPPAVTEALVKRAQHPIYGYSMRGASCTEAVVNWFAARQGWHIEADWIVHSPGVVPALNLLIRTLLQPGDKALIQPPVYYPFFSAVENNGGELVRSPLRLVDGRYEMGFEDLEAKLADPALKVAILCHPHNPVGRVWTEAELRRYGELCLEHGVIVISDEIHGDLVYPHVEFRPFASLDPRFATHSITCTAPSKTFNMAGLHMSNILIPAPELREAYLKTLASCGLFGQNAFGIVATEAAYREGGEWLDQLMAYLEGNLRTLEDFLAERLPALKLIRPEGTYLAWIDCRELGLLPAELKRLFFSEARVYFDEGHIFGPEGDGFERINIACPRATLITALERMEQALRSRQ